MEDITDIYRHAIRRLGEGVYFAYNKENGKTYPLDIQAERFAGQSVRFFIQDGGTRYYLDSPEFYGYINELELVGVVQLGIPHNKPNYIPLNFS